MEHQKLITLDTVKTNIQLFQLIQQECINRGYTYKTVEAYIFHTKQFLKYTKNKLKQEYFNEYITYLSNEKKVAPSTRNLAISALTFVFQKVKGEKIIRFPEKAKLPSTMPEVLPKDKILQMISTIKGSTKEYTLKHRLYIEIPYSSGLRVSELINLKVSDINLNKGLIYVRQGKGMKDRTVILSVQASKDIHDYLSIRTNKVNPYLFDNGKTYHISDRTVSKVLKKMGNKCNVGQRVHPHLLRDSFATHLLEQGTDSRYIQKLLGHAKLETTTKYTRVADVDLMRIKSPLDVPC